MIKNDGPGPLVKQTHCKYLPRKAGQTSFRRPLWGQGGPPALLSAVVTIVHFWRRSCVHKVTIATQLVHTLYIYCTYICTYIEHILYTFCTNAVNTLYTLCTYLSSIPTHRTVDHPAIPVHSSDEETDGCFRIVSCFTDLRGGSDIQCKVQKDPTSAVQN